MFFLPAVLFVSCAIAGARSSGYDYIIVGGGSAGCVLANRLSSDPSISVAVIEAGSSVLNDSRVTTVFSSTGPGWNTDLDWNYTTTPQAYADNLTLSYHAGKAVGGTSTINGMVYLRPAAEEINSWSALGNPGLSWDTLLPYYKRSERLQLPTSSQINNGASFDASVHGFTGPLKVGWWDKLNTSEYGKAFNTTWHSFELPWNSDPNTGNDAGLFYYPSERDVRLDIREDAARAFYWPVAARPNLHTFTNTTALRVILKEYASHSVAKGVQILLPSGKSIVLRARHEVILSAGTYRTPGLLEQSGIGNPSILRNLSITPRVALPGVGAHLQDQWLIVSIYDYNLTTGWNVDGNSMPFEGYVTATDIFGDERDSIAAQLRKDIPAYARTLSKASNGAISTQQQQEILNLRADLIFEKAVPVANFLSYPGGVVAWGSMPFSTGSVHSSKNPSKPYLNPNFLQLPWDALVQKHISTLLRRIQNSPAMQSVLAPANTEVVPGLQLVPVNASLATWTAYFKQALAPVWHGVGTAGMRKREWGGVVDPKFKVYGVDGLRVVDASVIPLQGNGNPTSTIYALAEMAADDILGDWGKYREKE